MEILIAIAVIVVGLVGVLSVFPVALRDVQINQDVTISAQLAQSVKSALRAGFANARYVPELGYYVVPLVHPGTSQAGPRSVTGMPSPTPEVLDYLELPATPGSLRDEPRIWPSYPRQEALEFYTISYESDDTQSVRSYGQVSTSVPGREDAFDTLNDPYSQYGFNILITPMEDNDNLFMVGIRICRNPELYTRLGAPDYDDQGVIKEEFFTVMSLR